MGSNSSTHVKAINSSHGTIDSDVKSPGQKSFRNEVPQQKKRQRSAEKKHSKAEVLTKDEVIPFKSDAAEIEVGKVDNLDNLNRLNEEQKQLAELERQNFELQDYIENLESQLEAVDREKESKGAPAENFTETVKLKEQLIQKLQQENESLKNDINKQRIKFKKKLRILNTKLTEEKNEASLHMLETQDELKTLREDNSKLRAQGTISASDYPLSDAGNVNVSCSNGNESHTNVILELSSKVSEQDARITQLENQLTEKNKEILRYKKSMGTVQPQPLARAETIDVDTTEKPDTWLSHNQIRKSVTEVDTRLHLDNDTDWYGTKTFEQISRQKGPLQGSSVTPQTSSRSFPGRDIAQRDESDSTKNELQAIAEEMKQLRKKKGRSKRNPKVSRPAIPEVIQDEGGLSGRDSGLSVDSQTISPDRNKNGSRNGSAVSRTSSVLSYDSVGHEKTDGNRRRQSKDGNFAINRPPSGGIRYDADVSHCDTDMGLSDQSENDQDGDYTGSECSTATIIDRSNIRQISAPRSKKRKGLLKGLMSKNIDNDSIQALPQNQADSGSANGKPPIYQVKPRDTDIHEAETLITSIDESALIHANKTSNSINLTAVS